MTGPVKTRLIAVIDTETNWNNEVMSIGIVLSDDEKFEPVDYRYYILSPEYLGGGMFSDVLFLKDSSYTKICTREEAMRSILEYFEIYGVDRIFAYNAGFDKGHLHELAEIRWFDIMKIAAYRQFNRFIPSCAPCCRTGKMKSSYGVQSMVRILSGISDYCETHNALVDALDELQIMRLLKLGICVYEENAEI